MGKVEIFPKKEITERLRAQWEMPEGAVFDQSYLEKYVERNRSQLPAQL
jgi:hypothetical protein